MSEFEQYQTSLTEEQVKSYLLFWKHKGFRVIKGRPPLINGWTVEVAPLQMVGIRPGFQKGYWSVCAGNLMRSVGEVGTMEDLKSYFEAACQWQNISLAEPPRQQHTTTEEPLSVWVKLNVMIGTAIIEAVYDPYLYNKTLANFTDLASLGVKFSNDLRLLTSNNNITLNWLDKFNTELAIHATLKTTQKEHARLIFLSDGRCLSPDYSLNKEQLGTINTVETAPKLTYFNEAWKDGIDVWHVSKL